MAGAVVLLASEPGSVTVSTTGDADMKSAFEASLRELLSRLDVALGDSSRPTVAAVDADFSEAECRLTVIDALGRTVLMRRMPRAGSISLDAEAAAHVVHSVVEELVTQRPSAPLKRPSDELPPAIETPVPVAEKNLGLQLGAFFGERTFAGTAPIVVGGGAGVTLTGNFGSFRPSFGLRAEYHAPVDTVEAVVLRVQTISLRGIFGLELFRRDRFRIDAGLGAGTDIFVATFPVHDVANEYPATVASPVLTLEARAHFSFAYVGLSVDADLRPPRFVLMTPGRPEPIFSLWRMRPSIVLGVSFDVL
jgi:hypothetical protein